MTNKDQAHQFQLYACLPFVELAHENSIQIGPILFWPASKFETFLNSEDHQDFQGYTKSISQIRTRAEADPSGLITTTQLAPQGTTCISIDTQVTSEQREFLLIDSLYLLYFACIFRDLYYGNEILPFQVFRKMIPASKDFIQNRSNWENLYIEESDREKTICIHLIDPDICKGLGELLASIYTLDSQSSPEQIENYKRLIRAIRYLVDRFFQRFVNLFKEGLTLSEEIFEPEDIIFLTSSFEALFNLKEHHPIADFKHKLRPLLHIKYSRPLEIFWKWVDDFYEVRRRLIHKGEHPDPIFKLNPNFEVSHILIGMKLFIYSVYYMLFKYQILSSQSTDLYTPPDFKWIHPEEILLFFWTEPHLLIKLDIFITKVVKEEVQQDELYADIHLLANLFLSMYNRYYKQTQRAEGVYFLPSPLKDLQKHGTHILEVIEYAKQDEQKHTLFFQALPSEFTSALLERLSGTS